MMSQSDILNAMGIDVWRLKSYESDVTEHTSQAELVFLLPREIEASNLGCNKFLKQLAFFLGVQSAFYEVKWGDAISNGMFDRVRYPDVKAVIAFGLGVFSLKNKDLSHKPLVETEDLAKVINEPLLKRRVMDDVGRLSIKKT